MSIYGILISDMQVEDRVYGHHTVTEPVLTELLNAPALQRLKGISQLGYSGPFLPGASFSRFEHSVGVCLLLRMHGAPLEEQIAGLIHDVSHAVFSHCVDHILNKETAHQQDYQDRIFRDFVMKTEIPSILRRHTVDPGYILTESNFPLQEAALPDLCADRIDYALREESVPDEQRAAFLEHLTVENNRFIFTDPSVAHAFAKVFRGHNAVQWSGLPSALMFKTVSDYFDYAFSKNYATRDDLYATESAVLQKIKTHHAHDPHLQLLFDRMNNKKPFRIDVKTGTPVVCKSRVIDPLCRSGDATVRVSDIYPEWSSVVAEEMKPKSYHIVFTE